MPPLPLKGNAEEFLLPPVLKAVSVFQGNASMDLFQFIMEKNVLVVQMHIVFTGNALMGIA